ncbi:hypothetical protein [Nonomuraea typhae]|uniref:hypothetical protein n=1 Tax=Nonomuraea typhae TaxID=2603600 RepID=UPI0012F80F36|nr:hypothetical protein [Nonomuraea typhae]
MTSFPVWPTVSSIPVSARTDDPPASLDDLAGVSGTGRDAGRAPAAPGENRGAGARGAEANPAAGFGFSGDPEQRGEVREDMVHAQRVWDAALAANRLDDAGLVRERQRAETAELTVTAGLLVDGRPGQAAACLDALLAHTTAHVLALDLGDVDGAGAVLHERAERRPDRVTAWHTRERASGRAGSATWSECRAKLLHLDTAAVHVFLDLGLTMDGDAITPLVARIEQGAVAAGWDEPIGPGRLLAVRRSAALHALPEDSAHDATALLWQALPGAVTLPIAAGIGLA